MHLLQTQSYSLLRVKDLVKKLGVARSTIYDWMNPESPRYDPSFPKRIHIGKSAVRWAEAQVDAWIELKRGSAYSVEGDGYLAASAEEYEESVTNFCIAK